MANYLIDLMTWSYSRINAFLQCPYQFYLKYISKIDEAPMFFSEYGSLVHDILAGYYRGDISPAEALDNFLIRFPSEAVGVCPSESIKMSYFRQGIDGMKSLSPLPGKIRDVEKRVRFEIDGRSFIGFVDLIYENADGALCILDHKSRMLKPRSARKKPTKTDAELDEYLRQLYLYSIPVAEAFGRQPDFLEFNCYRSGVKIKEQFQNEALDNTRRWALDTIEKIRREQDWNPNLDYWRCHYLCGFGGQCEYAQIAEWSASDDE